MLHSRSYIILPRSDNPRFICIYTMCVRCAITSAAMVASSVRESFWCVVRFVPPFVPHLIGGAIFPACPSCMAICRFSCCISNCICLYCTRLLPPPLRLLQLKGRVVICDRRVISFVSHHQIRLLLQLSRRGCLCHHCFLYCVSRVRSFLFSFLSYFCFGTIVSLVCSVVV